MNIELFAEDPVKREKGSPCYLDGMGTFYVKRVGSIPQQKEMKELKEHFYGFDDKDIDHGKLIAYWLAGGGITGWDDDEGTKGLEFNKVNANSVFLNEDLWESANIELYNHGARYQNYLHDKKDEDVEQVKKS